jgi:monoamine oxidase
MAAIEAVPTGSVTKIGFHLSAGTCQTDTQLKQGDTITSTYVQCLLDEPGNITWLLGVGGGNLATAYVGGEFSRDLALAGEKAQIEWATQHLCGLFGSSTKRSILGACATQLDREPWIDGGNSYCRSGTGNQRPALAEPIENRVFFAGEACSPDFPGTAHGAWATGISATECIANLAGE